jgi:hypothetical protein
MMPTPSRTPTKAKPVPWGWYALFVIPFLASLWVPAFNHAEPEAFGVPFFYWYLFLWIFLAAGLNAAVYLGTRERERERK